MIGKREANAIRKAQELGLVATVEGEIEGWWMVDNSRHDGVYYVHVTADGRYLCQCEAAQQGFPCCHAAAVWIVREYGRNVAVRLRLAA